MLSSTLSRLSSLIFCLLFANNVWATTTTQTMNVSGQGSDYIFVFRGNDPAFYDALVAYNPVGWTAVCHQTQQCAGTYYTISAAVQVDTQSLYLYVVDANGNTAYPDSGAWYYFTNETYPAVTASPATPVYSSSISAAQSSRVSKVQVNPQGHNAEVNIMGNNNDIHIDQAGSASYINLAILGNSNLVKSSQNMDPGAHAYNETMIIGNSNNLDILQTGSGNKTAFVTVNGNNNTANVIQKDSGQHYLQLDLLSDGHTANILQQGSGNHSATVTLDGSQPWNFGLTQSGPTGHTYSLPHAMSDGSNVSGTCNAPGGCNLLVNQQ